MDLQGADVEQASVPAEGALRVELQDRLRQTVVIGASANAARCVAQHLARLLDSQRHTVAGELGTQAEEVTQQEV